MKNPQNKIYNFDNFRFDAHKFALYYDDRLIKNIGEKPLRVLAVLLENENSLTSYEEIIGQVWRDNPLGVNSVHIAQYISKLRKVFAEFAPGKEYIETVKGRGYSFAGVLISDENKMPDGGEASNDEETSNEGKIVNSLSHELPEYSPAPIKIEEKDANDESVSSRFPVKSALIFAALISLSLVGFTAWTWLSETDDQKIRRVVEESQKYESMVLYRAPDEVEEKHLTRFWLTGNEYESELDIRKIRAGIERLIREKKYYGSETKAEQFEVQSVEINDARDFATVKTLEKWFIAEYFDDGTLHKNKTVGPYFVTYSLQKKDGRWLIEKSSTARAKPPTIPQ